ncbi:short transient receptor potential channel 4-associated protein-like [Amphiura filiformis]|uniref:short transient receptor potential channel 4-associated protein-like n=1 Tax=Amphiura filiformis TaxID=82378 RepID=UPI003B21B03D
MAATQGKNVFNRVRNAQLGILRPFNRSTQLPDELLQDCDNRLGLQFNGKQVPVLVKRLSSRLEAIKSGKMTPADYNLCMKDVKEMIDLLNSDSQQEYPDGSGRERESRIIHAEVFYLFDGVEILVDFLLLPIYHPLNKTSDSSGQSNDKIKTETVWRKRVTYHILELLHNMCLCIGSDVALPLSDREDLVPHLFTLMGEKSCFLKAATVLEDILGVKKNMIKLESIPKLKELVASFDEEQLANFCRVLSIAVSDTDCKEDHATCTLAAQDKASRERSGVPVCEVNQEYLVELPGFVNKLVLIACRKIENATGSNLSDLFNEIEGWVTWLDSSMAFDALAEVANDDGVFLHLPMNDPMSPIPQSIKTMHELVYKVEVLYVLCLLLGGKHRQKVHGLLANFKLMAGLNTLFDKVIWRCNLRTQHLHSRNENCDCSPEVALKVQFLQLLHSFCDHHENKYLIMTRNEINDLNRIARQNGNDIPEAIQNLDRSLLCTGQKGILTKLVEVTKKEPSDSPFRFWLSRAVESFLRGKTSFADQTFLLRKGLLEHIVQHTLQEETKSKEVLQSNFDLLAELMKFNRTAYKRFEDVVKTDELFEKFLNLINDNMVDSNMFVRCLILTLNHFEHNEPETYANTVNVYRLLQFISNKEKRLKFLIKLISIIQVEILTQENVSCLNTSIIFLMFADSKLELPEYLSELREEEQRQLRPGYLLLNFRELLFFWQEHYLHKDKDCSTLEKSSCISFKKWKQMVSVLVSGDIKDNRTIAHYLTKDELPIHEGWSQKDYRERRT